MQTGVGQHCGMADPRAPVAAISARPVSLLVIEFAGRYARIRAERRLSTPPARHCPHGGQMQIPRFCVR